MAETAGDVEATRDATEAARAREWRGERHGNREGCGKANADEEKEDETMTGETDRERAPQVMLGDDTREGKIVCWVEDDPFREITDNLDCRRLEHILSKLRYEAELRYEAAIHEMVEDFKRIQAEHKAEMASANSQLRRALDGSRLRELTSLSLAKAHGDAMRLVADVARRLEDLADEAHDWEGVGVAAWVLRGMAEDLHEALRKAGVER